MITYKVGKPVKTENHFEEYELEITFMHGDADAYDTGNFFYNANRQSDMEHMDHAIEGVTALQELFENEHQTSVLRKQLTEKLTAKGFTQKDIDSITDNFLVHDITDGGYDHSACVEEIKVYFYDANGTKHHVEAKVDGKKL